MKKILTKNINRYIERKTHGITEALGQLTHDQILANQKIDYLIKANDTLLAQNQQIIEIGKASRDGISELKKMLWEVRKTQAYQNVFMEKNPLISVRIPTYNKANDLVNVAIKSVLNQTYQNFEIIIVGDHCTDDTEDVLASLNDKRISFVNLPYRSVYPENPEYRWMVAGSPGMNLGAHLANGTWIAPLDDDDEFTPDHLEKLLNLALDTKSELTYGKVIQDIRSRKQKKEIWSYPPTYGNFSFQGAIYMKMLDFFQWDEQSWVAREPGDWNMCRRMLEAGVQMASTEDEVAILNMTPYQVKK